MRGERTFTPRDINRIRMTAAAARKALHRVSAPEPVVGEPGSQHVRAYGGVAARPAPVDPEMRKQTSGLCRYKSPRRPHMHVMPVIFPLLPAGCVRLPTETVDTPMAGCILWRER